MEIWLQIYFQTLPFAHHLIELFIIVTAVIFHDVGFAVISPGLGPLESIASGIYN